MRIPHPILSFRTSYHVGTTHQLTPIPPPGRIMFHCVSACVLPFYQSPFFHFSAPHPPISCLTLPRCRQLQPLPIPHPRSSSCPPPPAPQELQFFAIYAELNNTGTRRPATGDRHPAGWRTQPRARTLGLRLRTRARARGRLQTQSCLTPSQARALGLRLRTRARAREQGVGPLGLVANAIVFNFSLSLPPRRRLCR